MKLANGRIAALTAWLERQLEQEVRLPVEDKFVNHRTYRVDTEITHVTPTSVTLELELDAETTYVENPKFRVTIEEIV